MKVHGVVWAGVRTHRFEETVTFFRDVLGFPLDVPRTTFAIGRLPNTSLFEVFAPGEPNHDHFATGPVPSFLVDDVEEAARELRSAAVEVWGPYGESATEGWLHFRAPDGNVYGLSASGAYAR